MLFGYQAADAVTTPTTRLLLRKPKVEKAPPSASPRRIHLSTPCERPAIVSL
jgi:hypothetical protein